MCRIAASQSSLCSGAKRIVGQLSELSTQQEHDSENRATLVWGNALVVLLVLFLIWLISIPLALTQSAPFRGWILLANLRIGS